jgi:hypothetical protein
MQNMTTPKNEEIEQEQAGLTPASAPAEASLFSPSEEA